MYARLGFAPAIYIEPDILLVDEVLAVGEEVRAERFTQYLDYVEGALTMIVYENYSHGGIVHLNPGCRAKKILGGL